ncbi:MAG: hypothetical protein JSV91_15320 [Phycisphaerales bacterium]|nr:MAG: hypothetical protein JSV91_15320 [Phycisphaerales bacterium]
MTNGQARMLSGAMLVLAGVILVGLTHSTEGGPGGFGGLICLAGLVFFCIEYIRSWLRVKQTS